MVRTKPKRLGQQVVDTLIGQWFTDIHYGESRLGSRSLSGGFKD